MMIYKDNNTVGISVFREREYWMEHMSRAPNPSLGKSDKDLCRKEIQNMKYSINILFDFLTGFVRKVNSFKYLSRYLEN